MGPKAVVWCSRSAKKQKQKQYKTACGAPHRIFRYDYGGDTANAPSRAVTSTAPEAVMKPKKKEAEEKEEDFDYRDSASSIVPGKPLF